MYFFPNKTADTPTLTHTSNRLTQAYGRFGLEYAGTKDDIRAKIKERESVEARANMRAEREERNITPRAADGDVNLYTNDAMNMRQALRSDQRVIDQMKYWWGALRSPEDVAAEKGMCWEDYADMCRCLARHLGFEVEAKDIVRDWVRDTGGAKELDFAHFCASLFELVDSWTTSISISTYANFLQDAMKGLRRYSRKFRVRLAEHRERIANERQAKIKAMHPAFYSGSSESWKDFYTGYEKESKKSIDMLELSRLAQPRRRRSVMFGPPSARRSASDSSAKQTPRGRLFSASASEWFTGKDLSTNADTIPQWPHLWMDDEVDERCGGGPHAHLAPGCAADRFTIGDPGSETFLMVRSDANRHIKDGGNRYLLAPNMVTFMAFRAHVEAKNAAMASPNAATPHPRTLPRAMSRSETPLSEMPIYQGDMPVAPTLSGLLLRGAREIAPPTKGTCHQRQPASSGDVGLLLDHKAKVPKTTLSRLASEHLAKGETGNSLKAELWNSLLGYHTNDAVSEHVASCAPGAEHGNRPAYQFVVVAGPVSDEQLAAPRTPVPLTAREAVQTWDVRKAASWDGTQEGAPPRTVISAPANEYGAYDPARLLHTVAVGSSIYEPNNLDVPSIKGAASGDSFIRVPIASLPTETLTLPPHDPPLAAKHALFLHRLGARTAHVPFARSDMGRPVSPRSARELAVLQKEIL